MKKYLLAFSAAAVVGFSALIISSCESTPEYQEETSAPEATYSAPPSQSPEGSGTSAPAGSGSHY